MPIDKAQRYDAAVAGLRDLIARGEQAEAHFVERIREYTERVEHIRETRVGLRGLLDDLLREPPEPAHIEEAGPYCIDCGARPDAYASCKHKVCPHR